MTIIESDHKKQLETVWLQYIDKMPESLKGEILNFQKGTEMTSLSLDEQDALIKERDTLKNEFEKFEKFSNARENKSALKLTDLEVYKQYLEEKIKTYLKHDT